jgi:hypothetical protein
MLTGYLEAESRHRWRLHCIGHVLRHQLYVDHDARRNHSHAWGKVHAFHRPVSFQGHHVARGAIYPICYFGQKAILAENKINELK